MVTQCPSALSQPSAPSMRCWSGGDLSWLPRRRVFRAEFTGPGFPAARQDLEPLSAFYSLKLWTVKAGSLLPSLSNVPVGGCVCKGGSLPGAWAWRAPVAGVLAAPWCHTAASVLRGGRGSGLIQVSWRAPGQSGAQGQAGGLGAAFWTQIFLTFSPVDWWWFFVFFCCCWAWRHWVLFMPSSEKLVIVKCKFFPFSASFPPCPFTSWTKSPGLIWRWWIPQRGNFTAGSRCPF